MTAAEAAERYLVRRRYLLARIQCVDRALLQWSEWEANQYLPAHLRRHVPVPTVGRRSLEGLRAALVAELARLDGLQGRT